MLHYVDCWYDLVIVHEITVYGIIEFLNKDIWRGNEYGQSFYAHTSLDLEQ